MKRGILGSVLAFSLLGAVACGGDDANKDEDQNSAEEGDAGNDGTSTGVLDGGASTPSRRDAGDDESADDDSADDSNDDDIGEQADGGRRPGRGNDALDGGRGNPRGDAGRTRPERPTRDASVNVPRPRDAGRPARDSGPQLPPSP